MLGGTAFAVIASPAAAAAQTRYVSPAGDDTENDCTEQANPCRTVQYAVDQADPGDTVSIAAATYDESVRIRISLTLIGSGATTIISGPTGDDEGPSILVDGIDTSAPPVVVIEDLNVSNNAADSGIRIQSASATVQDTSVNNNDSAGIEVLGDESTTASLTVKRSAVSGNGRIGIVVGSAAEGDVTDSSVSNNELGGVVVEEGSLSLTTSTVSGTGPASDSGVGCGVCVVGGEAAVSASTIAGNTGQGVLSSTGSVSIVASTISGTMEPANASDLVPTGGVVVASPRAAAAAMGRQLTSSAGDLQQAQGTTLTATIVADNTTLADCAGDVTDGGYNLASDDSCAFDATGSANSGTAKLGALGDNGGPTQTMLPAKGSDALDAIPDGAGTCVDGARDQRGVDRPQGESCDIGAVEVAQTPILVSPSALPSGAVGHAYRVDLSASGGLGAPYAFSLEAGDSLPPGLHLTPGGVISGVPTQAGHFAFTLSIDDPTLVPRSITITSPGKPAGEPPALPNTGA